MLIQTKTFSHQGRVLEVRAALDQGDYFIRIYQNGRRASSATYAVGGVGSPQDQSALVRSLMAHAQADIESGLAPLFADTTTIDMRAAQLAATGVCKGYADIVRALKNEGFAHAEKLFETREQQEQLDRLCDDARRKKGLPVSSDDVPYKR